VRPNVRKNRQMRPSNAVRTVWDAEAIDTSHLGFRPIQKIATIHASSGFIRGIPSKAERLGPAGTRPRAQTAVACARLGGRCRPEDRQQPRGTFLEMLRNYSKAQIA